MGRASFAFIAFSLLFLSVGSAMGKPSTSTGQGPGTVEMVRPAYDEIIVGDTAQIEYLYTGSTEFARCTIFIDGAKITSQTARSGLVAKYSATLKRDRLYWAFVQCKPQGSANTITSYQTRFWLYSEVPYVEVALVSPKNGYASSTSQVTLTYNVKSNSIGSFVKCTLLESWFPKDVKTFPPSGGSQSYTANYTNGLHGWFVRCHDEYDIGDLSDLWSFSVQMGSRTK